MFASRSIQGTSVPCYAFLIVAIIVIFAYGYAIRHFGVQDVLERKVIDDPSVHNFDGWGATHLIFWAFLGFWFPGHYVQALAVSLGWEGFEDLMGRNQYTLGGHRLTVIGATDAEGRYDVTTDKYWYGRYTTDTAYNLMGYIVGSALASKYWPAE